MPNEIVDSEMPEKIPDVVLLKKVMQELTDANQFINKLRYQLSLSAVEINKLKSEYRSAFILAKADRKEIGKQFHIKELNDKVFELEKNDRELRKENNKLKALNLKMRDQLIFIKHNYITDPDFKIEI